MPIWYKTEIGESSASKDQIKRWTAVALLSAERNANYVKGYADLGQFIAAMEDKALPKKLQSA